MKASVKACFRASVKNFVKANLLQFESFGSKLPRKIPQKLRQKLPRRVKG